MSRSRPKIACCDATDWPNTSKYASGMLTDATVKNYLGLMTGHGYYSPTPGELGPNPITAAINASKKVWETETSDFSTYNTSWDQNSTSTSGYHWAWVLWDALVNTRVNAYLYWAATWNASNDNGWLIQTNGASYSVPKRVWAFANFSRFIRPSAIRIDATTPNTNLKVSAFRNADGSYAIVVLNAATGAESVTFSLQNVLSGGTVTPYLTNETNNTAQQVSRSHQNTHVIVTHRFHQHFAKQIS